MARNPAGPARNAPGPRNVPAGSSAAPAQRPNLPKSKIPKKRPAPAAPAPVPAPAPTHKPLPDGYTAVAEWPGKTAIVAYGTDYLPPPPGLLLGQRVTVGEDHLWMSDEWTRQPQLLDHTALWLGWILVPSEHSIQNSIWSRPLDKADAERLPEPLIPHVNDRRGRRAQGLESGMFRTVPRIHKQIRKRVRALQVVCDKATDALQRAYSTKAHELNSDSIVHRIIRDLRPPTRESMDMTRAWGMLQWGNLRSFGDFGVCGAALRRTVAALLGYISFVAALLPPGSAPELEAWAAKHANDTRRGLILAGPDIEMYLPFLRRHRIPTYLYVNLAQTSIPRDKIRDPDPLRCSGSRSPLLSKYILRTSHSIHLLTISTDDIAQKVLPVRWYKPFLVEWRDAERTGRGYLPHLNEDEFQLSDHAMKLKRKRETEEMRKFLYFVHFYIY